MTQLERERVQHGPVEVDARAVAPREEGGTTVARVAQERAAQLAQVDADLVRAARLGKRRDERPLRVSLQDSQRGAGRVLLDGRVDDRLVGTRRRGGERAVLFSGAPLA